MLWACLLSLTWAADDDGQSNADPLPNINYQQVEAMHALTPQQHRYLKPKRGRLPQNPYAQTDYTAYTVEWGELKLGLTNIQLGLLPRIQIGTSPVLDAINIYNVNAKVDALRLGPLDLAALGQYHTVPLGNFRASYLGLGGMASLRIARPWSVHIGGYSGQLQTSGLPTKPPPLLSPYVPADALAQWRGLAAEAERQGIHPEIRANAQLLRAATDLRFNRRDSLILQLQALVAGQVRADVGDISNDEVAQLIGLVLPMSASGQVNADKHFRLQDAYVFTVSYQMSFKQVDLRMGGGSSADGFAWLWQANELSVRAFGKTRRADTRRKRRWRKDKELVGSVLPGALPPAPASRQDPPR